MLYLNLCYNKVCYKGTALNMYSKTCLEQLLKNRQNKGLKDGLKDRW